MPLAEDSGAGIDFPGRCRESPASFSPWVLNGVLPSAFIHASPKIDFTNLLHNLTQRTQQNPMPSQSAIARNWKVSREYVHQCVKKGCPTDSFGNARLWRELNATKRMPTNPRQIAIHLAEEDDHQVSQAQTCRGKSLKRRGDRAPSWCTDSLDRALYNAIHVSDEAWRLLQDAIVEGKESKICIRLGVHNKAMEGRLKAEMLHREEAERRRVLIPYKVARELMRKAYDMIISGLTALPQNLAPRCNPNDAHRAMEVLQVECAEIIADAEKAFVT
jgi:hypothetical protein